MALNLGTGFQHWDRPKYIDLLVKSASNTVVDCVKIKCFTLPKDRECDDDVIADWALHVRRHYIFDEKLASKIQRRSVPVEEHLRTYVIPNVRITMAGDFGEMLVADILEYEEGYRIPRYKHCDRTDKNQSDRGSDVIGYKVADSKSNSVEDELIVVEVKAQTSRGYVKGVVSSAIKDSEKDRVNLCQVDKSRLGMTLNYIETRSADYGDDVTAEVMRRFSNAAEFPCVIRYGIGAIAATDNAHALLEKNYQYADFETFHKVLLLGGVDLAKLLTRIYEGCVK